MNIIPRPRRYSTTQFGCMNIPRLLLLLLCTKIPRFVTYSHPHSLTSPSTSVSSPPPSSLATLQHRIPFPSRTRAPRKRGALSLSFSHHHHSAARQRRTNSPKAYSTNRVHEHSSPPPLPPPPPIPLHLFAPHTIASPRCHASPPSSRLQYTHNISRHVSFQHPPSPNHTQVIPTHPFTHTHTHNLHLHQSIHSFIQTRGTLRCPPPPPAAHSPDIYSLQRYILPPKSSTRTFLTTTTTYTRIHSSSHKTGHSLSYSPPSCGARGATSLAARRSLPSKSNCMNILNALHLLASAKCSTIKIGCMNILNAPPPIASPMLYHQNGLHEHPSPLITHRDNCPHDHTSPTASI